MVVSNSVFAPREQWLATAVAVLIVLDIAGGLLAITNDVNTFGQAWSSEALLAAPWPMMVAQVLLAAGSIWLQGRGAVACASLLAAACLISAISGFFDGGLANDELSSALVAYQVVLLAWTAASGVLAAWFAVRAARERTGSAAQV